MPFRTLLLSFLIIPFTVGFAQMGSDCHALREGAQRHQAAAKRAGAAGHQREAAVERAEAVTHYHASADCYRTQDSLAQWLDVYWDLQALFFSDTDQALAYLDTARTRAWRAADSPSERGSLAWVEINYGHHSFARGRVLASIRAYERALALYKSLEGSRINVLEYVYKPLGNHYTRLGDNEKARLVFAEAIDLARQQGKGGKELGGLYNNLGITYWNEQRYAEADSIYQRGLTVASLPPFQRALLLHGLANNAFGQGRMEASAGLLSTGEDVLAQVPENERHGGHQELRAKLTWLRGHLAEARKDRTAAERWYKRALAEAKENGANAHRLVAKIWVSLGRLAADMNDGATAKAHFDSALHTLLPGFRPTIRHPWPTEAQLFAENTLVDALTGKAGCLAADQAPAAALKGYELALRAERKLWEVFLFEKSRLALQRQSHERTEAALALAFQLYEQEQTSDLANRALALIENSRAVLLLEAVQAAGAIRATNAAPYRQSAREEVQTLRRELAYLDHAYVQDPSEHLREQREATSTALARKLEELGEVQASGPGTASMDDRVDWVQQHLLASKVALLSYFWGPNHLYVVKVRAEGGSEFYRRRLTEAGRDGLRRMVDLLQSPEAIVNAPEAYMKLAHEQFLLWLAPFYESESGLVLSLDGPLQYLPFSAMLSAPAADMEIAKAPFLLHQVNTTHIYSVGVEMNRPKVEEEDKREALVILAPFSREGQRGLARLGGSELHFSRFSSVDLRRDAVATTEELLRAFPSSRVLHLSTHAFAASEQGLPRIELYDAPFYLHQLYQERVPAELVVLSACQTNVGALAPGEGVLSLARAFSYAGARSLIASQWSVNAAATSSLFRSFYEHLARQEGKSASLRAAQLDWLNAADVPDWQKSPHFWAGFTFLGEDGQMPGIDKQLAIAGGGYWPWLIMALLLLGGGLFWRFRP